MGPGTKRWKQKWPHIHHYNVHPGLCRIEGSSPVKCHTLQRGHDKSVAELQITAATGHFRHLVLRNQDMKRGVTILVG